MKKIIIILILSLVTACNSQVDGPGAYAGSVVQGVAAMGQVSSGTVTAYDFSNCTKGSKLAEDVLTDSNLFSLDIRPSNKETPILLELSNFTYQEEASDAVVTIEDKSLYASIMLNSGVDSNASISFWTHLAHARTEYFCVDDPTQVTAYILQSNSDIEKALTFDPITVMPEQITENEVIMVDVPAVKYGVANAAISYITANLDFLNGGDGTLHATMNSMTFAEIAFDDLIYDKFLNGIDHLGQINLGVKMISTDTYRTEIPSLMYYATIAKNIKPASQLDQVQIVADAFNKSTHLDIFTEPDAVPMGLVAGAEYADVSYSSCNYCWTNVGTDRPLPCVMHVNFYINDYIYAPVDVSVVYKSYSGDITPKDPVMTLPNDGQPANFRFDFPYNSPISERTLVVTASNMFGIENSFEVGIGSNSSGGGVGGGWQTTATWSPYNISCLIKKP